MHPPHARTQVAWLGRESQPEHSPFLACGVSGVMHQLSMLMTQGTGCHEDLHTPILL